MRIRASGLEASDSRADMVVCFACEGDRSPHGLSDAAVRAELARRMKVEGFRGGETERLVWNAKKSGTRHLVLGLGAGAPTADSLRVGAARAALAAMAVAAKRLVVRVPASGEIAGEAAVRAVTEGVCLGSYRFDRHLTDPLRRFAEPDAVEIRGDAPPTAGRRAVARGEVVGRSVRLARDLVNEAPSRMTPAEMARTAKREARRHGLTCRVLGPAELRRLGMHAVLSVARGSAEPPRVVHLTYKPARRTKAKRRVALVGKGVTFDSGGLDLKPPESMLHMKSDMAGAAAVLATMTGLADLGCPVEVHGLLGLTENMTGSRAYKPGDILNTHAGKTVEVGNTDAEGRLVLCDVLSYTAKRLRPTEMVDLATLTGACVVALGNRASGVFTRHEELRDALLAAGGSAGEKMWPLPLYEEYLQQLQKGPADLNNVGERWGGAITAALFLGEFVPPDLPWAHIDIAGPAFTEVDLPEARIGGTGAGVATLLRWLESGRG